jgi:hypothetical protein
MPGDALRQSASVIGSACSATRAAPEVDDFQAIDECVGVDAHSPHRDNAARMASITAL